LKSLECVLFVVNVAVDVIVFEDVQLYCSHRTLPVHCLSNKFRVVFFGRGYQQLPLHSIHDQVLLCLNASDLHQRFEDKTVINALVEANIFFLGRQLSTAIVVLYPLVLFDNQLLLLNLFVFMSVSLLNYEHLPADGLPTRIFKYFGLLQKRKSSLFNIKEHVSEERLIIFILLLDEPLKGHSVPHLHIMSMRDLLHFFKVESIVNLVLDGIGAEVGDHYVAVVLNLELLANKVRTNPSHQVNRFHLDEVDGAFINVELVVLYRLHIDFLNASQ